MSNSVVSPGRSPFLDPPLLMSNHTFEVSIFSLLDENLKPGPVSERNFGLFHDDVTPVYDVGIFTDPEVRVCVRYGHHERFFSSSFHSDLEPANVSVHARRPLSR